MRHGIGILGRLTYYSVFYNDYYVPTQIACHVLN